MADKKINTRIQLKYDTYANWTSNNPTPLAGEVCIVNIPASAGAVQQEPAILFKVGNGTDPFNSLPFASGLAADIYDWAKAANKPSYTADEISGLEAYIAGKVEDTDTQYKLEQDTSDTHIIKLMSQTKGGSTWTEVCRITTADTVYDDADVNSKIGVLTALVGSTSVADQIGSAIAALNLAETYEPKGAAATEAGKVNTALESYKTSNDAIIKAIKDGKTIDSFADVETALEGKQPTGDYATKAQAQGYADAKDASIAAAKQSGDNAQSAVDALKAKVGEVGEGTTIVKMIEDAITESTYDDSELDARVQSNEKALETLNGTGDGSVKNTAATEASRILNEWLNLTPGTETIDTWKEVIEYIAEHDETAAQMLTDILKAQGDIAALGKLVGDTAVAAQISTAIEGAIANLATVAKTGDIADLTQANGYIVFNCGSATVNI